MENMINQWVYRATRDSSEKEGSAGFLASHRCPFYCAQENRCTASVAAEPLSTSKRMRCCSDEYDDCPSYLAYLLRRSKALRCDSDWLDAGQ
ncbi:hypothetical protein SAMN02745165_03110 [Malonomonas rubra DSM 5091]|uniref:Uncharacterized protein n=1 Tax=Malonomonas rubra DSM 5091 TaxID=1122189 RepID=A0A1M6LYT9_MALRU|nr:hypothetical protein [Malonomonas rubra]SHJ76376.1 hypothetical protein SAMN02745165_03110 [Malonomonas rubra DSM 5091]